MRVKQWDLNHFGPRVGCFSKNLVQANEHKAQLEEKINKEIDVGRVMGPFSIPSIPNKHISLIGLVLN